MTADKHSKNLIVLMAMMTVIALIIAITADEDKPLPQVASKAQVVKASPLMSEVVDGIHTPTGLIADQNFELVVNNCTSCHAPMLITQNRQTADGWKSIIEWMQEKQNLWDLGKDESAIIEYLAKNYAPENEGRRRNLNLKKDEWYVLE
ncbi:MAG TPA: hypothetical protein VJ949_13160 [Cryomorphaceae bacterium]|nr:hypothetical protein [Cryomorphaceae bacterium]HKL39377.1 hypothetical protein [Cryomorphaceae bacterium]